MIYQRGWKGPPIARIQQRLAELGLYRGPVDGLYGGGTESTVKVYQRANGLAVDGKVGPHTWEKLFGPVEMPPSEMASRDLSYRCLALTGSFETGQAPPECFAGLAGDADKQGISLGALQQNFGQQTLQPLLRAMLDYHYAVMETVFGDRVLTLAAVLKSPFTEQMDWIRSIQHPITHQFVEPWRGMFKTLGRTDDFQAIQLKTATTYFKQAVMRCKIYNLWSERAVALMFDIQVQNGGINKIVQLIIEQDFKRVKSDDKQLVEIERMRIIANRRADAANPRYVEDVRRRKLAIANGVGTVHGEHYDLEAQYGIGLREFAQPNLSATVQPTARLIPPVQPETKHPTSEQLTWQALLTRQGINFSLLSNPT